jgi:glycosyltransferase involved in cell wall biosynthesis
MTSPKVTFIVPCYKLAHLLPECIESILAQTYGEFEILIMDDCSPDNTQEVAQSFADPRVKYVRNETNLRHLRNYNKGITLALGDYIWLISADDKLRKTYVLERYMQILERNANVGFAFCPGMGLRDDQETGPVDWATLDYPEGILSGHRLLRRLLVSNCILAPAGLVRKRCYEELGVFPLDLPFAGDWFLWCLFAIHYDVAYFREEMISYREHAQSMTDSLSAENVRLLSEDDLTVRWRIKMLLEQQGETELVRHCMDNIVEYYTQSMASKRWRGTRYRMNLEEFELSLVQHAIDPLERENLRRRVFAGLGGRLYLDSGLVQDAHVYRLALEHDPGNWRLRLKYLLLCSGAVGATVIKVGARVRSVTRRLLPKGSRA